jgi:F0F1-type ATP synthase delta subunit
MKTSESEIIEKIKGKKLREILDEWQKIKEIAILNKNNTFNNNDIRTKKEAEDFLDNVFYDKQAIFKALSMQREIDEKLHWNNLGLIKQVGELQDKLNQKDAEFSDKVEKLKKYIQDNVCYPEDKIKFIDNIFKNQDNIHLQAEVKPHTSGNKKGANIHQDNKQKDVSLINDDEKISQSIPQLIEEIMKKWEHFWETNRDEEDGTKLKTTFACIGFEKHFARVNLSFHNQKWKQK